LESSKGFAKEFMKKYNIPTADFEIFFLKQKQKAIDYLNTYKNYPIVLKADGLAAGKGVVICEDKKTAIEELENFFSGKFGSAGQTIVMEEFMLGEEASILALTDGNNFITLASSQDHKRAFDGDKGPNTGGMGAYSPAPIVTDEILEKVKIQIIRPTLEGMKKEGSTFKGCLYVGLMINNSEPKVVEYNVRFGDPETQAVLVNFKGDFSGLLLSIAEGELDESYIDEICDSHSCCVVMTSEGYPGNYPKGQIIRGIKEAEKTGAVVFHAGTALKDGNLTSNGGRVLGITGIGNNLKQAVENAYNAVNCINFDKSFYRKDIAHRAINK
jgi:phosphoribosylamine--glycine ligase